MDEECLPAASKEALFDKHGPVRSKVYEFLGNEEENMMNAYSE